LTAVVYNRYERFVQNLSIVVYHAWLLLGIQLHFLTSTFLDISDNDSINFLRRDWFSPEASLKKVYLVNDIFFFSFFTHIFCQLIIMSLYLV